MPLIVLTANEALANLTNLAIYLRLIPTNTSNKPKDFLDIFMTETLENGNTKIFPASDLPEVFDYQEKSTVTVVTKPTVSEGYLQVSEKKVVKSSFPTYILEMAFTNDSGMNQFVGYMIGQMEDARINYMYDDVITNLFSKTLAGQQLQTVNLLPVPATGASEINATWLVNEKNITEAIQEVIDNIQVYNKIYNDLGYTENISKDDLVFLYCQPYYNKNVINLVATLLNSSVLDSEYPKPKTVTIPRIKIPDNAKDVIGILMHKKAFQVFYKFVTTLNFYDVSNLWINYFQHFWYGRGWVPHLPVIKFVANTNVA